MDKLFSPAFPSLLVLLRKTMGDGGRVLVPVVKKKKSHDCLLKLPKLFTRSLSKFVFEEEH